MGRRDIVKRYIDKLESLYEEHNILKRAQELAFLLTQETEEKEIEIIFHQFDSLDKE